MIGYYDKVDAQIIRVPFRRVHLARDEYFSFDIEEEDGTTHMVPFHPVREVWRNGELLWQRTMRGH
jgi:hypothetical protein